MGYRQYRRERSGLVLGQQRIVDFAVERGATELEPVIVTRRELEIRRTDISTAYCRKDCETSSQHAQRINIAAIAPGVRTYAPEPVGRFRLRGAMSGVRFINFLRRRSEWKERTSAICSGLPPSASLVPAEAFASSGST